MDDKRVTVGQKVAKLADWWGLSQRELAEVLGDVSRSTVASYANNPSKNPHHTKVRGWAKRFGIPYEWFVDGIDSQPQVPRDYQFAETLARLDEDPRNDVRRDIRERYANLTPEELANFQILHDRSNIVPVRPEDQTFEEEMFSLGGQMVDLPLWQGVQANLDETHFIEEKRPRTMKVPPFFLSRKKLDRFIVGLPAGKSMAPRIVSPDRVIVLLTPDAQPKDIVVARRSDGINFIKVLRINRMGDKELHSINPDFPPITDLTGWIQKGVVVGIWKPYIDDGPNIEFNGGFPLKG